MVAWRWTAVLVAALACVVGAEFVVLQSLEELSSHVDTARFRSFRMLDEAGSLEASSYDDALRGARSSPRAHQGAHDLNNPAVFDALFLELDEEEEGPPKGGEVHCSFFQTSESTAPATNPGAAEELQPEQQQPAPASPLLASIAPPTWAHLLAAMAQRMTNPTSFITAPVASAAGRPIAAANPNAPAGPSSPEMKGSMGPLMPYILQIMFGNTNAARSRGYAYGMYGYMPFGDGYGGGMLNDGSILGEGGAKPWWYDFDGTGAQYSTAAIGQGDFLPVRGPPCPPDCGLPDYDSPQPM